MVEEWGETLLETVSVGSRERRMTQMYGYNKEFADGQQDESD